MGFNFLISSKTTQRKLLKNGPIFRGFFSDSGHPEQMVICAMVVVKNEKKLFSQDDFLFWAIFDENLTFMSSANDF